jgi:hypothetical protein
MNDTGYFLFSLDTELAIGRFDHPDLRKRLYSTDGIRERQAISRILKLCEEFEITGTWALVGHLFFDKCEYCPICPMMSWKGKYPSFEELYGTNNPLYYGPDIIEMLLASRKRQELGFHGFSHNIFDEKTMTPAEARTEIQLWLQAAKKKKITPYAIVFPRNRIGHLDILQEAGLICYRGTPERVTVFGSRFLGKIVKTLDHILSITRIPIYDVGAWDHQGMIKLMDSQYLFEVSRKIDHVLNLFGLHNLPIQRIIKGIERAASEKKMIHIWVHPCDLRTEQDFLTLRLIFDAVSREVNAGRMRSVGMAELARIIQRNSPEQ